jgi:hypothetical protein
MATEHQPAGEWLRTHWEELQQFNFRWVAATEEGLISTEDGIPITHEDLGMVMSRVAQTGLSERAVYAFVDFVRPET